MKFFLVSAILIFGVSCQADISEESEDPFEHSLPGIIGSMSCPFVCPGGTICKHGSNECTPIGRSASARSLLGQKLCSTGADCGSQAVCVDGKCVVDNGNGGKCSVGAHCPNGYICVNARCVQSKRRFSIGCQSFDCMEDNRSVPI